MPSPSLPAKKTKIVSTIGPASASQEMLERMMAAGMNIASGSCVALIFQPAEEGGGGGREGQLARKRSCWSGGRFRRSTGCTTGRACRRGASRSAPGPFFAAADQFDMAVDRAWRARGQAAGTVDTTVIGAQVVMALHTIASRNADPVKNVVVSVTSVPDRIECPQRDPGSRPPEGHGVRPSIRTSGTWPSGA